MNCPQRGTLLRCDDGTVRSIWLRADGASYALVKWDSGREEPGQACHLEPA